MKNCSTNMISINDILQNDAAERAEKNGVIAVAVEKRANSLLKTHFYGDPEGEISAVGLADYLCKQDLSGGVDVVLRRDLDCMPGAYSNGRVIAVLQKNTVPGKKANVLWLSLRPREHQQKNWRERLNAFVANRCPDLSKEQVECIVGAVKDDDLQTVNLRVFDGAKPVVLASRDNAGGAFILQKVNSKGQFVPHLPIGYVRGSDIWLSIPEGKGQYRKFIFSVTPKLE